MFQAFSQFTRSMVFHNLHALWFYQFFLLFFTVHMTYIF